MMGWMTTGTGGGELMGRKRRRLAERRKAVGLSQEGLAEVMGVDRSTVVRWERADTEPQPWHRPKLARALKVSVEELAALLRSEEHTSELQSQSNLVCRLLLEKKTCH